MTGTRPAFSMRRTGKKLFMGQLGHMMYHELELEFIAEKHDSICKELAEKLDVPEEYYLAFRTYCLNYILDGEGEGALDDEYDKVYHFYRPIFDKIEAETDTNIDLYIEPSRDEESHLAAIVTHHKEKELKVPFVVYRTSLEVWWPFFDKKELPESIYEKLERIYNTAHASITAGLYASKNRVFYVRIQSDFSGTKEPARGVIVNGHLIVAEDPGKLSVEEIANGIAAALGTKVETQEMAVWNTIRWDWNDIVKASRRW